MTATVNLCRDAVKHIRIEWFVLHRHTHTHYLQHLHFRCIEYQLRCRTFILCCLKHVCSNKTSSYLMYAQGISILSIDIPDVEPMNSPLCNNLVKALVLEGQSSREKYAVGPASPDSPTPQPLLPTLYCYLTTSSQPPPPPSSSVISIHPYRTIATNPRSPHPRFELTLLLIPSLKVFFVQVPEVSRLFVEHV